MNCVQMIGRVERDPELRHTGAGQSVVNLLLKTREDFTDKEGAAKTRHETHRLVCWGERAEQAQEQVRAGDLLAIEGKLQSRRWTDDKGHPRTTVEVTVLRLSVLSLEEEGS